MKGLLALDQGTTSSRAIVYDLSGKEICSSQMEFKQHYPRPGWVEHDPEDIWQSTLSSMQEVLNRAKELGVLVIACGITNQRETTLIWDRKTGKPVANAIVWQDRRTASKCERLQKEGHENFVSSKTGLLLDPYFSATKIAWLLDNVTGARKKAERGELAFGTVDSFLIWRLTGAKVHATDVTNASRTSLYDIKARKWSQELASIFDIPMKLLPDVRACDASYGTIDSKLAGLDIPITGVAGDQQAAAIGQTCFLPGDMKSTYGTGNFILVNTGDQLLRSTHRLLGTIAYEIKGKLDYALEGSVLSAGSTMQWVRDGLELIEHASESEELAKSIDDTDGVYLVPAFTGLGAPHWDAKARGALTGLTRGSEKAHIVRAALESVAYQSFDLLNAMDKDGVTAKSIRVDGGMVRNNWLLQFLADITNCEIERPRNVESTALGAAMLAGLGCGIYQDVSDVSALRGLDKKFKPSMPKEQRDSLINGWQSAVQRVLN